MKKGKNNEGFALLIVILIIAVLGAMVAEFLFGVRLHAEMLANHRNGIKARYIGRSAFNSYKYLIEMKLLSSDTQQNLLVLSQWVGFGGGLENIEGGEVAQNMLGFSTSPLDPDPDGLLRGQWNVPLPSTLFDLEGDMYGRMVNERGKLNLNTIVTIHRKDRMQDTVNIKMYNRMFTLFQLLGIEDEEAFTCLDGIVDWVDGNIGTEPRGAEEDYYRSLDPNPYYPRDHFLESVDEIRLVNGCTPDIVERVKDFVTVYPRPASSTFYDYRVDAATAPKPVLMAIFIASEDESGMAKADEELAAQIAEEIYEKAIEKCGITVTMEDGEAPTVSSPSLLNGKEVKQIIGDRIPGDLDLYTWKISDPQYYQIKGYGQVKGVLAGIEAVVSFYKSEFEILSWKEN